MLRGTNQGKDVGLLVNIELAIKNKQSEERKTIRVARATRVKVRTSDMVK